MIGIFEDIIAINLNDSEVSGMPVKMVCIPVICITIYIQFLRNFVS
jgi:hypothetical protein